MSDPGPTPRSGARSGGQVADCTAADRLLDRMPATDLLHGDKGYDSAAVRRKIEEAGAAPNIPLRANKRWKNCFSPYLYRNRNVIEIVMSVAKQRWGEALSARTDLMQRSQALLKGAVCNVKRLVLLVISA